MPAKKEQFDVSILLDEAEPTTPMPIEQRVQLVPARPYLSTQYLAERVPDAKLERGAASSFPTAVFPCPVCTGTARAEWGRMPTGPFKLTCSGSCNPPALRRALHDLAPAAFEPRDDILYAFSPETEKCVVRAVVDGNTVGLDQDARRAVRRFREMGGDISYFAFRGPGGDALMVVFRRDHGTEKSFLPVHITVDPSDREDVEFTFPEGLLPLFGWDDLSARPNAPVLVVEGEATALAAKSLLPDHVIITSACGSSNAGKSDWSPLHNREVWVWPDNDEPGTKYARSVAAHSFAVRAKSVRIVRLPEGLADGWDLADEPPPTLSLQDVRDKIEHAPDVAWGDVKDALKRPDSVRHYPPFRLPDGMFATDKIMVKAVEKATTHLDPGCKRGAWLGMLGAIYHALGEAGFAIADAWSSRDGSKHGKYRDGEVRRIFDAFAASPPLRPLPILALFRSAMKQSKALAGDSDGWKPDGTALTRAYITEFETEHRKLVLGDNVIIGIQKRLASGAYEIQFMAEKNAESVYRSRKAPDFDGKSANLFSLWQNYQRIPPLTLVFEPGKEVGPTELNQFRGLDVQPIRGGSYSLFREHLDAIMAANGDSGGYLWKLIAYRLQHLDTFVPALLVLIGLEGGGKSSLTSVIARLLAPYSVALSDPEKFVGRNNAALQGKLFVQLEEMILGRREEYDSRLKHYVTSATLDVEEKYKAQWQIPNRLFVAITANKREAVRVTEHSRRFAVYEVADRFGGDQAKREAFFGRMHAELENGGLEALAYDLIHTDLEGFSPAAVPKTKLFMELAGVDADRDPLRGWWRETLESGVLTELPGRDVGWTELVEKDQLYMRYQSWCERDGPRSKSATLSKAEWAKQLSKMLPGGLMARRQMASGKRAQYYAMPPYEDCCGNFERMFGTHLDRAPKPGQLRAVM